MARIRTIKPELYRHELLQELEERHAALRPMLVFQGLMTQADRAGRFRWNPRVLKLDVLPFVTFDLEASMDLLLEHGLLVKYETQMGLCGCFPTWAKHQAINGKERASQLPPPPSGRVDGTMSTRDSRVDDAPGTAPELSRGEREREREQGMGTGIGVTTPTKTDVSLFSRILCEKTGIFGTRDQAEVHDAFRVFHQTSGMSLGEAVEHMAGRWEEYRQRAPELAWTYGGAHKFFTNGQWNRPEMWPRRNNAAGSGIDGAEHEAARILAAGTAGNSCSEAVRETRR